MRKIHEQHGESKSRLYKVWRGMLDRCYRPEHDSYPYYGGRGIDVCDEWRKSYVAFSAWAKASGYRTDKSIDRIDNARGYSSDNCRWSTEKQQARNKTVAKSHLMVAHDGRTMNLLEWSRATKIGYTTLVKRYKKGLSGEALLSLPKMHRDHMVKAVLERRNGKAKLTDVRRSDQATC